MGKILWLDTETTGVNPYKHSIVQIAAIAETDGVIEGTFNHKMQPIAGAEIDLKALEVNNTTEEELRTYMLPANAYELLVAFLGDHIDKYNKADKFVVAGYNVKFDTDVLRQWFLAFNDKYYGSWFFWPSIDVAQTFVEERLLGGTMLDDYKLATVCTYMGIQFDAHDAMADIEATRTLYYKLKGK